MKMNRFFASAAFVLAIALVVGFTPACDEEKPVDQTPPAETNAGDQAPADGAALAVEGDACGGCSAHEATVPAADGCADACGEKTDGCGGCADAKKTDGCGGCTDAEKAECGKDCGDCTEKKVGPCADCPGGCTEEQMKKCAEEKACCGTCQDEPKKDCCGTCGGDS